MNEALDRESAPKDANETVQLKKEKYLGIKGVTNGEAAR